MGGTGHLGFPVGGTAGPSPAHKGGTKILCFVPKNVVELPLAIEIDDFEVLPGEYQGISPMNLVRVPVMKVHNSPFVNRSKRTPMVQLVGKCIVTYLGLRPR